MLKFINIKLPAQTKFLFLRDINPVIRYLIITDTIIFGAAGLLGPLFALFIEDYIVGGGAAVAGIAAGVYLLSKSLIQIPAAQLIDKIRGERDDFWLMFICNVVIALLPLSFLFISTPIELYVVQFLFGIATAFTFPSFLAIFTRHVDKNKEGTEWGIYYTCADLTSGGAAIIGGLLVATYGFYALIIASVIISVLGSMVLLLIRPYMKVPQVKGKRVRQKVV